MTYLLRLDSSPRGADSYSRRLGDAVEARAVAAHGLDTVRRRDLDKLNLPHISQTTIEGFYTPPEAMTPALRDATRLSDDLISELKGAGAILVTAPIYNFGAPSSLKAWIDQIVRIGHTFGYDGTNFEGLVPVSNAYLALAYGSAGYGEGEPMRAMNHLEPYLTSLLQFLGVASVQTFMVQGTTGDNAAALLDAAIQSTHTHFAAAT